MDPPPRSLAADAHDCIMVRILIQDSPHTRLWGEVRPADRRLPSDRRVYPCWRTPRAIDRHGPDQDQRDIVLAAVKAWPGDNAVRDTPTATAILDGGCAQRHWAKQIGTKKRPSGRTKKLNQPQKCESMRATT
jgi:hypothetical protein